MFSPEDQQVQICLMKSNLEDIENNLTVQYSALPELDAENRQQYRETMSTLREVRAQNDLIERLKQDNVRLTAKRNQLRRQREELSESLQSARESRARLVDLIREEEKLDERNIRNYEDSLRDKAERFRRTRRFYDEELMTREFEEVNNKNCELENEVTRRQNILSELKTKLEVLKPDVPENLPALVGKIEMDEELKMLIKNCEELRLKVAQLNK